MILKVNLAADFNNEHFQNYLFQLFKIITKHLLFGLVDYLLQYCDKANSILKKKLKKRKHRMFIAKQEKKHFAEKA